MKLQQQLQKATCIAASLQPRLPRPVLAYQKANEADMEREAAAGLSVVAKVLSGDKTATQSPLRKRQEMPNLMEQREK